MDSPSSTPRKRCPTCPSRPSEFPPYDHNDDIVTSSPSTDYYTTSDLEPAEHTVRSQIPELSALAASVTPEYQADVSSHSGDTDRSSISAIVEVGSDPSCTRRSIESIMLGRPHPYRADDMPEEGNDEQETTQDGAEDPLGSFPQVLMDQALSNAITKLHQAKARRAVAQETAQNDRGQQAVITDPLAGTNHRTSVRSDSFSSSYYSNSKNGVEYDEDDGLDDFETNAEAWRLGTEMAFALDHLRACTNCWSTFKQISATRKEAGIATGETDVELAELAPEELEQALARGTNSWEQHKEFIIEFREGVHHDASIASADGKAPNAECVFRIGFEHLQICAGCPGFLVAPESAPRWTQDPPQEEICWICGQEASQPASEVHELFQDRSASPDLLNGSCYSCQEAFRSSPPQAPYRSWSEYHDGRISPSQCQCSRGLGDNYDRCVSPIPSRYLASSPQYYPRGLEINYSRSNSSKSSRSLTYSPAASSPRGLDDEYDGRSPAFSPCPFSGLGIDFDRHIPLTLRRSFTFSSGQATLGSPTQDSDNGSIHTPLHSSSSSGMEHKCICFKCGREPFEISGPSVLVSGMRSPRSSTPALSATSTFVPPPFHKSLSRQDLNHSPSQTTSPITDSRPRAPPPSPAFGGQGIAGPAGYRRQFRQANSNSRPATPSAAEKTFKFTFPGKRVTGMAGRSPSPLDLNTLREPKPRRTMPPVVEVLTSHPHLEANFDSSPPLPEEDMRG